MTSEISTATRAVRAAIESDTQHGAVVPPLHLSSNYAFAGFGEKRQYDYTRSGNPTRDALGEALMALEGGAGAVVPHLDRDGGIVAGAGALLDHERVDVLRPRVEKLAHCPLARHEVLGPTGARQAGLR